MHNIAVEAECVHYESVYQDSDDYPLCRECAAEHPIPVMRFTSFNDGTLIIYADEVTPPEWAALRGLCSRGEPGIWRGGGLQFRIADHDRGTIAASTASFICMCYIGEWTAAAGHALYISKVWHAYYLTHKWAVPFRIEWLAAAGMTDEHVDMLLKDGVDCDSVRELVALSRL